MIRICNKAIWIPVLGCLRNLKNNFSIGFFIQVPIHGLPKFNVLVYQIFSFVMI